MEQYKPAAEYVRKQLACRLTKTDKEIDDLLIMAEVCDRVEHCEKDSLFDVFLHGCPPATSEDGEHGLLATCEYAEDVLFSGFGSNVELLTSQMFFNECLERTVERLLCFDLLDAPV